MNCIIIEDEIPAQRILKSYIKKIPDLTLIDAFQTATNANTFFKTTEVDIVLLDINLPDITGLDFIKTVKKPPKIIVTTAYPEFAVESFELDTIIDYLVKPFSFDRFLKAITKAEKFMVREEVVKDEALFLNIDKTIHKVYISEILYLESDRNYLTFVLNNKKLTIIDSLKKWETLLITSSFVQIHKSYLVNVNHVNKYSGSYVFIHDQKIPIGRTYKHQFLAKLSTKI